MSDSMIENEVPEWRETGRSPQWNELFAALAKAQGEIGGAKKDSTNPHFRSSYADLASVREVTQEPLSKNGLAIVQWPRTANGGVEIETILGHASGQYMTGVLWMPVNKLDAHGVGSAITYGRRYALMAVTGVAPVDDDGNGASDRSGVAGSAGGGGAFRPPGPRRANWVDDAKRDGTLDEARSKGAVPGKPSADAIKMAERAKKAIAFFKDDLTTHESAREYWREREDPIAEIEAAMPQEYERMLDAYNTCLERTKGRAV